MYTIQKEDYGVRLTFAGFIREVEMKKWAEEIFSLLEQLPSSFGMFIDMREMTAMPAKSQEILLATQKTFKPRVERSASITASAITNIQSKRIGNISGVNATKLFVDATETPNWEEVAINWITKGINPYATK